METLLVKALGVGFVVCVVGCHLCAASSFCGVYMRWESLLILCSCCCARMCRSICHRWDRDHWILES